ncbi:MAG: hypothetical protein ACOYVD_14500 [Bacillota bacterium]
MAAYSFIPPLCLSCRVSLEEKMGYDQDRNVNYSIHFCPNCQEVYHKKQ